MLDATHGPDVGAWFQIAPPERPFAHEVGADPGRLKIAWTVQPTLGSTVHPACVAAVEDAVKLLEELGHDVIEAHPAIDTAGFGESFLLVIAGELGADLRDAARLLGRAPRRNELEAATWALGLLAGALSAQDFASALRHLELVARQVGVFFQEHDVLLTPTLATPPPRIGEIGSTDVEKKKLAFLGMIGSGRLIKAAGLLEEAAKTAFDFIPWTPLYNVTGQPAMSVPLCWSDDGLPIGVHFVARFAEEATLFRLGSQLERARPWFDRLPGMARAAGSGAAPEREAAVPVSTRLPS
jgi:amidase